MLQWSPITATLASASRANVAVKHSSTATTTYADRAASKAPASMALRVKATFTAVNTPTMFVNAGRTMTGSSFGLGAAPSRSVSVMGLRTSAIQGGYLLGAGLGGFADTLDDREKEVIKLYFGLSGEPEMTLEEIGLQFHLTRERVRQIKEKALRKLRHPTRGRKLISFSDSAVAAQERAATCGTRPFVIPPGPFA